ncbi:hypothetical protein [Amycolatopsis arida]|nr:hypothetical protein [Amycolatopsis arida]
MGTAKGYVARFTLPDRPTPGRPFSNGGDEPPGRPYDSRRTTGRVIAA